MLELEKSAFCTHHTHKKIVLGKNHQRMLNVRENFDEKQGSFMVAKNHLINLLLAREENHNYVVEETIIL